MKARGNSRSLEFQKLHFFVGLTISLIFTVLVVFNEFNFWFWQASVMDRLLTFAGVSHRFFILSGLSDGGSFPPLLGQYIPKGPTFEMSIHYEPIPSTMIMILLAFSILAVNIIRRISPPIKAAWSVISILAIFTLFWETSFSPISSYKLHWVTIDWSCSGVINLCLITLIYVPFLFTIRGPLWVKVFWLLLAVGFSIVWNLLRLSFVTATLYYFGGLAFLLFHYMVGAFIEFVYIVAFYSLALAHLSQYPASWAVEFDA